MTTAYAVAMSIRAMYVVGSLLLAGVTLVLIDKLDLLHKAREAGVLGHVREIPNNLKRGLMLTFGVAFGAVLLAFAFPAAPGAVTEGQLMAERLLNLGGLLSRLFLVLAAYEMFCKRTADGRRTGTRLGKGVNGGEAADPFHEGPPERPTTRH